MISRKIGFIALLSCILSWTGCTKDGNPESGDIAHDYMDMVELSFALNVPGTSAPSSRALTAIDETYIRDLDIFIFRQDGGEEKFFMRTHATDIEGTGSSKSFKVSVPHSRNGEQFRIVALANLRADIDMADSATPFTTDMTKEQLLSSITFDTPSEWPVDTPVPGVFRPLPMWGESQAAIVVDSPAPAASFGTIRMLRSVARVDVGLNIQTINGEPTAQGLGNTFNMTNVRIYNTNAKGYAAPAVDNLDNFQTNGYYTSVIGATAVDNATNVSYLEYELDNNDHGLIRDIYLSEAGMPESLDDAPFFLIGGYFGASQTKTWYRIDLFDRSAPGGATHMELMRNCRYTINIQHIGREGYTDENIAINSPVNIEYEVSCEEEDVSDITYNNKYMLGVSRSTLELGRIATDVRLVIATDHPAGWRLKVSTSTDPAVNDEPSWFHFTEYSGNGPKDDFVFSLDEYTGDSPRKAYIHIFSDSDNLHKIVEVIQTSYEELSLDIFPTGELIFSSGLTSGQVETQTVSLRWSPANIPVNVQIFGVSGGTKPVELESWLTSVTGNGEATYEIKPKQMDVNDIMANHSAYYMSRLEFSVTHTNGRQTKKSISLRQRHFGLSVNPAKAYSMIGNMETLSVVSSLGAGWKATLIDEDGTGVIEQLILDTNHSGGADGYITFLMKTGNPDFIQGTSRIRFSSIDDSFQDTEITIKGYWGHIFKHNSKDILAYYQDAPSTMTRPKGNEYCQNIAGGWRLPTQVELQAMYYAFSSDMNAVGLHSAKYFARDNDIFDFIGYNYYNFSGSGSRGSTLNFLEKNRIRCVKNL